MTNVTWEDYEVACIARGELDATVDFLLKMDAAEDVWEYVLFNNDSELISKANQSFNENPQQLQQQQQQPPPGGLTQDMAQMPAGATTQYNIRPAAGQPPAFHTPHSPHTWRGRMARRQMARQTPGQERQPGQGYQVQGVDVGRGIRERMGDAWRGLTQKPREAMATFRGGMKNIRDMRAQQAHDKSTERMRRRGLLPDAAAPPVNTEQFTGSPVNEKEQENARNLVNNLGIGPDELRRVGSVANMADMSVNEVLERVQGLSPEQQTKFVEGLSPSRHGEVPSSDVNQDALNTAMDNIKDLGQTTTEVPTPPRIDDLAVPPVGGEKEPDFITEALDAVYKPGRSRKAREEQMREGGFGGDMPEGMTHEGLDQYMGGFGIRHTNRQKIADMLAERWNLSPAEAEEMAEEAVNNETANDGLGAALDSLSAGRADSPAAQGGGMDDISESLFNRVQQQKDIREGRMSAEDLTPVDEMELDPETKKTMQMFDARQKRKRERMEEENVETSADPLSLAWNHLTLLKRRV